VPVLRQGARTISSLSTDAARTGPDPWTGAGAPYGSYLHFSSILYWSARG
jgi:hypothetical protein